jgi:multicomponent Na+:H+ antiporter subunit E
LSSVALSHITVHLAVDKGMKHRSETDRWHGVRYLYRELVAFCCLFVFWILITGSFSAGNLIRGLIAALVVVLVTKLVFRIGLPEDVTPRFLLIRFPMFLAWLGWEIIKANINLALILLRPRLLIDPKIVSFRSALAGDFRNTVLADAITVTPGTLTLDAEGDLLTVHCLAPAHKSGLLEDRIPERMVRWLFRRRGEPVEEPGG